MKIVMSFSNTTLRFLTLLLFFYIGCEENTNSLSNDPLSIHPTSGSSPVTAKDVAVHRGSMPGTGEHFYTTSMNELTNAGFHVEAYDYFYLEKEPTGNSSPFYRCLKVNGQKHFYTTDKNCEGAPGVNEGLMGYISQAVRAGLTPLHRLYNSKYADHLYTVRFSEVKSAMRQGYKYEAIVGYVSVPSFYITPIYESAREEDVVSLKERLAPNGSGDNVKLGFSFSTWYLREISSGFTNDFAFNDRYGRLENSLQLAKKHNLPVVINFNGGRWTEAGELTDYLRAEPFYRLLIQNTDQILTASTEERQKIEDAGAAQYQGWLGGMISFELQNRLGHPKAPTTEELQRLGLVTLYRLLRTNPTDRLYTTNPHERDTLLNQGFQDEGIAGYVLINGDSFHGNPVVPLRRFYNQGKGQHRYVTNESERSALIQSGWREEGLVGYILQKPTVSLDQEDKSLFRNNQFGKQFFCLSRLNYAHYKYKKRNIQAAASRVNSFREQNSELLVGVSLDSETMLSEQGQEFGDYNPMSIEEWRQWLSNTGIYDPHHGEYAGQGRNPVYRSIGEFNKEMGTKFNSWDDVQPERIPKSKVLDWINDLLGTSLGIKNKMLWTAWRHWTMLLVDHHTQDMANWIAEKGIPKEMIYNHQTPEINPTQLGDSFQTAELFDRATVGITTYGSNAQNPAVLARARSYAKHFGIFEWNAEECNSNNPSDIEKQFQAIKAAYDNTARVIAPYAWPIESNWPCLSIKDQPLEHALRKFIQEYKDGDMAGMDLWGNETGATVKVHRLYTDLQGGDHMLSRLGWEGGYAWEDTYHFYRSAETAPAGVPNHPVFRCLDEGGNDHFVSHDSNCEGRKAEGKIGHLLAVDPRDRLHAPLYRCLNEGAGDHFTSRDENCEGQRTEGIIGFMRTSELTDPVAPPVEPPPPDPSSTVRVYRTYRNGDHMTTRTAGEGGYTTEDTYHFYDQSAPNGRATDAVYRCYDGGANDHFVSHDSNCEGRNQEGSLGYLLATDPGDGLHAPLFRCLNPGEGDHFTSRDGGCEGQHGEGRLGFMRTRPL